MPSRGACHGLCAVAKAPLLARALAEPDALCALARPRLIDAPTRRISNLAGVQAHAFFAPLDLAALRSLTAPFVPQLEGDADTGYFDDFENPEDMAKYKEVQEKARNVERVDEGGKGAGGRGMWAGFTFKPTTKQEMQLAAATPKDACDAFSTMF
jgi:hypothetical protein